MELEFLLAAVLISVATTSFGHFEQHAPLWTRLARWLTYLAVTFAIGHTAGRPWTFVWLLGLPAVGATFHVIWCRRHGINPLTAQPRDRYLQLRTRRRTPEPDVRLEER